MGNMARMRLNIVFLLINLISDQIWNHLSFNFSNLSLHEHTIQIFLSMWGGILKCIGVHCSA